DFKPVDEGHFQIDVPPGSPELARVAAREQRRTAERVRVALADGAERDVALHEARKAAKRARYAGETAVPVAGAAAERYVERMKAVQEALGEHQDAGDGERGEQQEGVL
ncbi:CHAD domain-containing protein, partial [Kitasatospora putterlickiae]|uniref:CHAD domain-containing protein n=1 Tax=Kitasatospora putterlickiae TaxID=221725 RepID=UPI0031E25B84